MVHGNEYKDSFLVLKITLFPFPSKKQETQLYLCLESRSSDIRQIPLLRKPIMRSQRSGPRSWLEDGGILEPYLQRRLPSHIGMTASMTTLSPLTNSWLTCRLLMHIFPFFAELLRDSAPSCRLTEHSSSPCSSISGLSARLTSSLSKHA